MARVKKINLLPAHKKRDLYYESLFHGVTLAAGIGATALILGVVVQIATGLFIDSQLENIESQIESIQQIVDKDENNTLKAEIRSINNQMGDFLNLFNATPQWSSVIKAFAFQVPNDITITTLEANLETRQIDITGYSPTRQSVIELYNNINADREHFEGINYPLENVAQPTEIDFSYTFFVKQEVLTPPQ